MENINQWIESFAIENMKTLTGVDWQVILHNDCLDYQFECIRSNFVKYSQSFHFVVGFSPASQIENNLKPVAESWKAGFLNDG